MFSAFEPPFRSAFFICVSHDPPVQVYQLLLLLWSTLCSENENVDAA